jgi:hypothetical protein
VIDRDELVRMRIGKSLEEHAVDDGEDRAVRADSDRQRQHREHRETGNAHQLPDDVLQTHDVIYGRRGRDVPAPLDGHAERFGAAIVP